MHGGKQLNVDKKRKTICGVVSTKRKPSLLVFVEHDRGNLDRQVFSLHSLYSYSPTHYIHTRACTHYIFTPALCVSFGPPSFLITLCVSFGPSNFLITLIIFILSHPLYSYTRMYSLYFYTLCEFWTVGLFNYIHYIHTLPSIIFIHERVLIIFLRADFV